MYNMSIIHLKNLVYFRLKSQVLLLSSVLFLTEEQYFSW